MKSIYCRDEKNFFRYRRKIRTEIGGRRGAERGKREERGEAKDRQKNYLKKKKKIKLKILKIKITIARVCVCLQE